MNQLSTISPDISRGDGIGGSKELLLGLDPADGVTPRRQLTRTGEVTGNDRAEHELPAPLEQIQAQENITESGSMGGDNFERFGAVSLKASGSESAGLLPGQRGEVPGSSSAGKGGGFAMPTVLWSINFAIGVWVGGGRGEQLSAKKHRVIVATAAP